MLQGSIRAIEPQIEEGAETLAAWRERFPSWGKLGLKRKRDALTWLISWLDDGIDGDDRDVPSPQVQIADVYLYAPGPLPVLFLDKHHPSIISTLHEYGHHLFGPSELTAQQFAVHVFKRVYPKAFAALVWKDGRFTRP